MNPNEPGELLKRTVGQLSDPESLHGLFREVSEGDPMPPGGTVKHLAG